MSCRLFAGALLALFVLLGCSGLPTAVTAFLPAISCTGTSRHHPQSAILFAGAGFGASNSKKKTPGSKKKSKKKKPKTGGGTGGTGTTYVKSEQEDLIAQLAQQSANTCLGRAVAETAPHDDPFWELMPSLIHSRFPNLHDAQLERVAGVVRHALDRNLPLEDEIIQNPHRPQDEIHAYMPGLGSTKPFHDPSTVPLCQELSDNYDTILQEYHALMDDMEHGSKQDRFQSVTSMNYDSGWKTLVLFYNGHRIEGFPYHLCPVTTQLLESVPLAGRIAGFNRQQPQTGIPMHTDGNNMWLTCQMGIQVPDDQAAYIRVGPETRRWATGECLLYDTTYEHETFNEHAQQERVVLHVDFFNTIAMTPEEIQVMQYIYSLREEFMKAEGVAKVGAQIL
ncbi:Aspartate beta-hydroxylase domain-containing protein 2 [Seminavis robusta]|uniref:Aspartate beta-hydroxylase domain-containing protein 2 n=1 Tax=Seminavis robusta TaxID=568900 RepID=A0A9N8E999_9STRA|nr:Aspartate beta-hydroxylase domain-containing protein 2 [Seminavis robusta]|eukprot:Sro650_g181410.1 Aspartate beta-hydroxylase domain-containing protein 2 (394) ;mRNA; r:33115-34429